MVAGGQAGWNQGGSFFTTVLTLSPGSSAWTSLSELPKQLQVPHASIVGGRLRIVGRSEVKFLSDLSPIIGYSCHSLTDSLTDSLTAV